MKGNNGEKYEIKPLIQLLDEKQGRIELERYSGIDWIQKSWKKIGYGIRFCARIQDTYTTRSVRSVKGVVDEND